MKIQYKQSLLFIPVMLILSGCWGYVPEENQVDPLVGVWKSACMETDSYRYLQTYTIKTGTFVYENAIYADNTCTQKVWSMTTDGTFEKTTSTVAKEIDSATGNYSGNQYDATKITLTPTKYALTFYLVSVVDYVNLYGDYLCAFTDYSPGVARDITDCYSVKSKFLSDRAYFIVDIGTLHWSYLNSDSNSYDYEIANALTLDGYTPVATTTTTTP